MATFRPQRTYPGSISIIEQPSSIGFRFRYRSETGNGRTASSIRGVNSTDDNKSYPKIQINVHDRNVAQSDLFLVVSCVTADQPSCLAHPNKLIGNDCCTAGVFRTKIPRGTHTYELKQTGILRVTKRESLASLEEREQANVDPFKNGFSHKFDQRLGKISRKVLRLCFQLFYRDPENQKMRTFCEPVVSDIIESSDKNTIPDLAITRLSDCITDTDGNGKEIILWCGKVKRDDIEVIFFQEDENGEVLWEAKAPRIEVEKKNSSIAFQPPPYHMSNLSDVVQVKLKLYRPSDGKEGEARDMMYLPASTVCMCKYYRAFLQEKNVVQIPKMSPKPKNYDIKRASYDSEISKMAKVLPTLDEYDQITQSTIMSMDWNTPLNDLNEQKPFKPNIPFVETNKTLENYPSQPTLQSINTYYQADQSTYPLNVFNPLQPPQPPIENQYLNPEPTPKIFSLSEDVLFNSEELRNIAIDAMEVSDNLMQNFGAASRGELPSQAQITQQCGNQPSNDFCQKEYNQPGVPEFSRLIQYNNYDTGQK